MYNGSSSERKRRPHTFYKFAKSNEEVSTKKNLFFHSRWAAFLTRCSSCLLYCKQFYDGILALLWAALVLLLWSTILSTTLPSHRRRRVEETDFLFELMFKYQLIHCMISHRSRRVGFRTFLQFSNNSQPNAQPLRAREFNQFSIPIHPATIVESSPTVSHTFHDWKKKSSTRVKNSRNNFSTHPGCRRRIEFSKKKSFSLLFMAPQQSRQAGWKMFREKSSRLHRRAEKFGLSAVSYLRRWITGVNK